MTAPGNQTPPPTPAAGPSWAKRITWLFENFGALLVFIAVEHLVGLFAAIVSGIITGAILVGWQIVRDRKISPFTAFVAASVVGSESELADHGAGSSRLSGASVRYLLRMKKRSLWAVAAFASVIVVGCGSSSSGSGNTNEHLSEQSNGGCPASPTIVTGTGAEGSTCAHASDCLPTCCSCSTGTGQWLAAECLNDKCEAATACADTAQPSFCK